MTWTAAAYVLLGLAMVLICVRLARGPSVPDRVVALDLLTTALLGVVAVAAVAQDAVVLLDVALVLALVGFIGTVAFARYIEGRIDRG